MNQAQEASVSQNGKSTDVMNESKGSNKPAPECLVIDDKESDIEIIPEEAFKRYQHISRIVLCTSRADSSPSRLEPSSGLDSSRLESLGTQLLAA